MRVLVIAYYFPPVGGGGVSRTLKLVRGLVDAGAEPLVLTVDGADWVQDPELLAEIPPGTRVLRLVNPDWGRVARRVRPSGTGATPGRPGRLQRWLVPDLHVGWSALATPCAAALSLFRAVDVVYTTCPPYSVNAAGLAARALGVPWVADFRDAWTDCPTRAQLPAWRWRLERRMEEMTLRRADRVIFASPAARDRAMRRVEGLAARSETVLTGFDAREFPGDVVSDAPAGRLEVVHAGSVLVMNRLPTLLRLLAALQMWSARDRRVAATVNVRFVGAEPAVRDCIARAGLASWVRVEPPVGRAQLSGLLRGAHVCLALASSGRTGGDPIPGKMFDAIGAGRPVLALAPPSALATLVREHSLGRAVDPVDGRSVVAALSALHECALRGEPIPGPSESSRRAFASDAAVARIITALERVRRGGRPRQEGQRCVYPSAS